MTLYLMQAVGSDPSAQPDLISSTMPSMGVPFQKASLAGWAAALPKRARANKHTTLLDTILLSSSWCSLTEGRIVCDSFEKDPAVFIQLFQIQHVVCSSGRHCLSTYEWTCTCDLLARRGPKCKGKLSDTNPRGDMEYKTS